MQQPPANTIEALLSVMARLRDPKDGCPWDLEQDFHSLVPHTLEEAYEVADAVAREDAEDLQDELGDLLLHVVFYAQLAAEARHFAFGDVVQAIVSKLIRRHPHIFQDERQTTAEGVKTRWEEIKAEERQSKGKASAGLLDAVPPNLPGLMQAAKLQAKAAKVGFDWPAAAPVFAKVAEELEELKQALPAQPSAQTPTPAQPAKDPVQATKDKAQEELGDLLFTCVNLARHLQVDADAALRQANAKFRRRFAQMEAAAPGKGMQALTSEQLEALWQQAKAADAP